MAPTSCTGDHLLVVETFRNEGLEPIEKRGTQLSGYGAFTAFALFALPPSSYYLGPLKGWAAATLGSVPPKFSKTHFFVWENFVIDSRPPNRWPDLHAIWGLGRG